MKKALKKTLFIFLGIILMYSLFIAEESLRLKGNFKAIPLIVTNIDTNIKVNEDEHTEVYSSIGFELKNIYLKDSMSSSDNIIYNLIGQELILFGKHHIWSWIS